MVKRYQVYLNPSSVETLDEVADLIDITRSQLIREAIDAAATRIGSLLAGIKPPRSERYSWLNNLIGSVSVKGKKMVNLSEKVDEIYYS